MEIGPTFPSPLPDRSVGERRARVERQAGEVSAAAASTDKPTAPQALDAAGARREAQRTAALIRERRENGYYHRSEVLREVASRLLESRDLERVADSPHQQAPDAKS